MAEETCQAAVEQPSQSTSFDLDILNISCGCITCWHLGNEPDAKQVQIYDVRHILVKCRCWAVKSTLESEKRWCTENAQVCDMSKIKRAVFTALTALICQAHNTRTELLLLDQYVPSFVLGMKYSVEDLAWQTQEIPKALAKECGI